MKKVKLKPQSAILGEGEYGWFLLDQLEDHLAQIANTIYLGKKQHLGVYSRRTSTVFHLR